MGALSAQAILEGLVKRREKVVVRLTGIDDLPDSIQDCAFGIHWTYLRLVDAAIKRNQIEDSPIFKTLTSSDLFG